MTKRKVKNYTEEFKRSSAELAINSEQPISTTATELGVNPTTLYGWVKRFYPSVVKSTPQQAPVCADTEELKRLRKENTRLRQERDILKKAAAYFAGEVL